MIFEGKESSSSINPEQAKLAHERKLYSRKITLFGEDPNTWDLRDNEPRPENKKFFSGRHDKVDEFEEELKRAEMD